MVTLVPTFGQAEERQMEQYRNMTKQAENYKWKQSDEAVDSPQPGAEHRLSYVIF